MPGSPRLSSDGREADDRYRESIDRLERAGLRVEVARGHLLYGEWLRRDGRRVDAREQLRTAHDLAVAMGLDAVAERARIELLATGEKVRKRSVDTADTLTAQEFQIARLARDGLSNTEIGTRLFLSPRTVEWHLRKVFSKLDVTSRRQLRTADLDFGPAYQVAEPGSSWISSRTDGMPAGHRHGRRPVGFTGATRVGPREGGDIKQSGRAEAAVTSQRGVPHRVLQFEHPPLADHPLHTQTTS